MTTYYPPLSMSELRERTALSMREVAGVLNVSLSTAYRLADEGRLPLIHVGHSKRVSAPALVAILEEADKRSDGPGL